MVVVHNFLVALSDYYAQNTSLAAQQPIQPTPLRGPKIVGILKIGFGSIAFPIYRSGAADGQAVRRFPSLPTHVYLPRSASCGTLAHTRSCSGSFLGCDFDTEKANMKVKEVLKLLEDDGWLLVRTTGSHRQFKHPTKPGTVTVAGKPSLDMPPGTLNSILKQAGLK